MTARRAMLLIVVLEAMFCAAVARAGGNRPNLHFIEGGIVTWVDAFQILLLSIFAVAVYRARRTENDSFGAAFWLVVAAGAVYLMLDESFEFHEQIGQFLQQRRLPRPPLVNGWGDVVLIAYALPVLLVCWLFRREIVADPEILRYLLLGAGVLILSQLIDTFGVHQGRERFWWSVAEESTKLIGFGILLGTVILKWTKLRQTRRASEKLRVNR
jgi:hypothetical protein